VQPRSEGHSRFSLLHALHPAQQTVVDVTNERGFRLLSTFLIKIDIVISSAINADLYAPDMSEAVQCQETTATGSSA